MTINNNDSINIPDSAISQIKLMIERRNKSLSLIEKGIDLITEAVEIAPEYAYTQVLNCLMNREEGCQNDYKDEVKKYLDLKCWEQLLENLKYDLVINNNQLSVVYKDIQKKYFGLNQKELTHSGALTVFNELFANRGNYFREGLVSVIKKLLKMQESHDAFEVEKLIVLTVPQPSYDSSPFGSLSGLFNDFCRYMFVLDEINPKNMKHDDYPIRSIKNGTGNERNIFDFDQFRVMTFQNGNIHICFDNRPDLLDRINTLIAEHFVETLPN